MAWNAGQRILDPAEVSYWPCHPVGVIWSGKMRRANHARRGGSGIDGNLRSPKETSSDLPCAEIGIEVHMFWGVSRFVWAGARSARDTQTETDGSLTRGPPCLT
jgi:hypothetical protein